LAIVRAVVRTMVRAHAAKIKPHRSRVDDFKPTRARNQSMTSADVTNTRNRLTAMAVATSTTRAIAVSIAVNASYNL
jgi:hypothetical protein